MAFLKQSLTPHSSIVVHDAIIEQTSASGSTVSTVSIILPYATMGDLGQFLVDQATEHPAAQSRLEDIDLGQALLTQSVQLISALKFLHEGFYTKTDNWHLFCAHLDLKPANIIIFKPDYGDNPVGEWKLCDFGISVFQAKQNDQDKQMISIGDFYKIHLDTMDTTMKLRPQRFPGPYQAPEIEHNASVWKNEHPTKHVGRSSDVWSFGAIFSEVLAYASGGSHCVKAFRKSRRRESPIQGDVILNDLFYTSSSDDEIGPSSTTSCITRREVTDWLDEFSNESQPEPASRVPRVCFRCWAVCIKSILKVHAEERPASGDLFEWISELQHHGNNPGSPHVRFGVKSTTAQDLHESTRQTPMTTQTSSATMQSRISLPTHQTSEASTHQSDLNRALTSDILSPMTLQLREPSLSPFPQAKVISHDIDGSSIAYLMKDSVELHRMSWSTSTDTTRTTPVTMNVRQPGCTWKGVHLSSPYLVIWGRSEGGRNVDDRPNVRFDVLRQTSSSPLTYSVASLLSIRSWGEYIPSIHAPCGLECIGTAKF